MKYYFILSVVAFVAIATNIGAQRRGGGGGRVNLAAAQSSFRSTQSVNRSVAANRDIDQMISADRDIVVERDVDVNANYDRWGHPIARGVNGGVAIGTAVATLPSGCSLEVINGIGYDHCGSTWYEPFYSGMTVQYLVVSPPR